MQVIVQPFWAPKEGSNNTEYEDAFWPRQQVQCNGSYFRFAVADGATETSYSKIWAQQLVDYFCNHRNNALVALKIKKSPRYFMCYFHKRGNNARRALQNKKSPRWFVDYSHEHKNSAPFHGDDFCQLQKQWSERVHRQPLPWYAEEKARCGAFAAILGLVLSDKVVDGSEGRWQAVAIGDSCLFQVRGEDVVARFPLSESVAFNNRPHLLSSNPNYNSRITDHLRQSKGTWQPGDAFYLMTDALACWFLRELEEEQTSWLILRNFGTRDEQMPFHEWLASLRAQKKIRNDDVTLLRVEIACEGNTGHVLADTAGLQRSHPEPEARIP
jgi:hypothetical protein